MHTAYEGISDSGMGHRQADVPDEKGPEKADGLDMAVQHLEEGQQLELADENLYREDTDYPNHGSVELAHQYFHHFDPIELQQSDDRLRNVVPAAVEVETGCLEREEKEEPD